jgi:hypothetical protein
MRFTIQLSLLCDGPAATSRRHQYQNDKRFFGARSSQLLQRTHARLAAAKERRAQIKSPKNS